MSQESLIYLSRYGKQLLIFIERCPGYDLNNYQFGDVGFDENLHIEISDSATASKHHLVGVICYYRIETEEGHIETRKGFTPSKLVISGHYTINVLLPRHYIGSLDDALIIKHEQNNYVWIEFDDEKVKQWSSFSTMKKEIAANGVMFCYSG